jgi:hypothetical protein
MPTDHARSARTRAGFFGWVMSTAGLTGEKSWIMWLPRLALEAQGPDCLRKQIRYARGDQGPVHGLISGARGI